MGYIRARGGLDHRYAAQNTIIKIPVTGSPLEPGTPEVFVNRAGGGPNGIIIDEHDNLWIACNQSDEVMVLEPTQGRAIARLGDFGGIDQDGAPIGFLSSNSLVFHGDDVLVNNLSADISATAPKSLRTVDGPWAAEVKLDTISKIKKCIPGFRNDGHALFSEQMLGVIEQGPWLRTDRPARP